MAREFVPRPVSGTLVVRVRELGPLLGVLRTRSELSREMDGPDRERT